MFRITFPSSLLLYFLFAFMPAAFAGEPFTKNNGQVADTDQNLRPDVKFYTSGNGATIFLREDAISWVFSSRPAPVTTTINGQVQSIDTASTEAYRIDMELVGANTGITISGDLSTGHPTNYYLAHCPNGITNVPAFEKVIYENVYDGIDLVCYQVDGQFKYDFIVQPGADPGVIQLQFHGGNPVYGENGSLIIESDYGNIEQAAPTTFTQDEELNETPVRNEYVIGNNGFVTFNLDGYDAGQTLVIDPLVKNWVTYFSNNDPGNRLDNGLSIQHDSNNNLVMLVSAGELTIPANTGQLSYAGSIDYALIQKLANGNIGWVTYYGGNGIEAPGGIGWDYYSHLKIDSNNNVIISGATTSNDLPLTNHNNVGPAFLAKFSSTGNLSWATYYGAGINANYGQVNISGLALNSNNDIFISGIYSHPSNGSVMINPGNPAGSYSQSKSGSSDAFIAKFSGSGTWLWGTLYGGNGSELVEKVSVAIDNSGNIILAGSTSSTTLPGLNAQTSMYPTKNTSIDLFIAKFGGASLNLITASYIGGNGEDRLEEITSDNMGNIYLTGYTYSTSGFPGITSASFQSTLNGTSGHNDIFILKLKPDACTHYKADWATYYGSTPGFDFSEAIRFANNRLYIAGYTEGGSTFPVSANTFKTPATNRDMFLLAFEPHTGKRIWGICDGGSNTDQFVDLTINGTEIYCIGRSASSGLQTTGQTPYFGGGDIIVYNLTDTPDLKVTLLPTNSTPYSVCSKDFGGETFFASGPGGVAPLTYAWYLNGVLLPNPYTDKRFFDASLAGKYVVEVTDANGLTASEAYEFKIYTSPEITLDPTHIVGCVTEVTVTVDNFQAGHTYNVCVTGGGTNYGCFTISNANPYNITALLPGTTATATYTVTVTDNTCLPCTAVKKFSLGNYDQVRTLGAEWQVTSITGNQTYSGIYLVKGSLDFAHATVTLTPGTRFYVDPYAGTDPVTLDIYEFAPYTDLYGPGLNPVIIKVGSASTFNMQGATITALCSASDRWGGIYLTDISEIRTQSGLPLLNPAVTLDSEISKACVGVGSAQLSSSSFGSNTNTYYFSDTKFDRNSFGFWDVQKTQPVTTNEGIVSCDFTSNGTGVFFQDDSGGGDYTLGSYQENNFTDNETGIAGRADNIDVYQNTFQGNTDYSIHLFSLFTATDTDIIENIIEVPAGAVGIKTNTDTDITLNQITAGTPGSGTGIEAYGSNIFITGNFFTDLEAGVLMKGFDTFAAFEISGNTFTDNYAGVLFPVNEVNPASAPPAISCNTFEAPNGSATYGILIEQGARMTNSSNINQLGGNGTGFPVIKYPPGNLFDGIPYPVYNKANELTTPLTYWVYALPQNDDQFATPPGSPLDGVDFKNANINGSLAECPQLNLSTGVQSRQGGSGKTAGNNPAPEVSLGLAFPNPAQTYTSFPYKLPAGTKEAKMLLREVITGQVIETWQLTSPEGNLEIRLENLRNGLYSYTLETDGNQVSKLLKVEK